MKDDFDDIKSLKDKYESIEVPQEIDFAIEKAIERGRRQVRSYWYKRVVAAAACLLIFSTLVSRTEILNIDKSSIVKDSGSKVVKIGEELKLPVIGTKENLVKLLGSVKTVASETNTELGLTSTPSPMKADATKSIDNASENVDYSSTNIQVQGVDEADEVKTDGDYIYKVGTSSLTITKATPVENMAVIKTINFDKNFSSLEIFLKDKYIVVLGVSRVPFKSDDPSIKNVNPNFLPNSIPSTKAIVYDISDKSNPKKIREVEIGGNYASSRMIGSEVYIVSNQYCRLYYSLNNEGYGASKPKTIIMQPLYKDSAVDKDYVNVAYKNINYMPDNIQNNYIITASMNLEDINEKANISTTLGSGDNIYVSDKNMYVAGISGQYQLSDNIKIPQIGTVNQIATKIYKYSLNNGDAVCVGTATVPGTIINQFSMDEFNSNFRIATNSQVETIQQNNVYVLDEKLSIIGKLEGIAKGESIYSTRFIGDRLYMVTYKNTDPLFVIDLKVATTPKILGELKIPGFSNYLQPYDETHILGFGRDTEDVKEGDAILARPKGFKMALFDVSDVNKPIQNFSTIIGDYGTSSELLTNHKALLFSKDKNIISFPITVTKATGAQGQVDTIFQGAYVYGIDMTKGFQLKCEITHITKEDMASKNYYGEDTIKRIIYIGDNLYTLSDNYIRANSINTMAETGNLKIK